MKKLLLILFCTITSLQASDLELVLFVPKAETDFCIALHNLIKTSPFDVIEAYKHPVLHPETVQAPSELSEQLFNSCYALHQRDHREMVPSLSKKQLHSMILTMTRSADSRYQEIVVENNLSQDAFHKCLGVLKKRAISTTSDRPCPNGYTKIIYGNH
ncbi:hypothetical protein KBC04_00920 [Candidatus Babeliales bacterium]|nr:hypothetical protein [Candidatus Babeliales bacterium]MBP9843703.1 hypothetical protein [Candidatus Babeliales bacterium]